MKRLLLWMLMISILPICSFVSADGPPLKAAFIRNDDLWVKDGAKEVKITNGAYVRYPKWSKDGKWLAYLQGKVDSSLWIYNFRLKKSFPLQVNASNNFQWSSTEDHKIGFQVNNNLFVADAMTLAKRQIASNVKNFSWLPNESGLLISKKENKKLNSNIILSKILFNTNGGNHMLIEQRFFSVPVGTEEIVVSTSEFKWSHDRKWLSFILEPTASISADSNTLCLLSSDGRVFKRVEEMLDYGDWLQWAPTKNILGYIGGIGREALKGKQLYLVSAPSFKQVALSPKGYVDRGLAWVNNETVLAVRTKESEWMTDYTKRPMPHLVEIGLADHQGKQVTFPSIQEGDFAPQVIGKKVFWVRTNRERANVYVSGIEKVMGKVWIKDIAVSSTYYEKWYWDEVFSVYKGQ